MTDLDEIKKYLDSCIRYWRKKRDENNCEFAKYYIDAFQSVRNSIFNELLDLKNKNATYPIFLNGLAENSIDWLLEEHKERIKLKQWEKDLIYIFKENFSMQSEDGLFWPFKELKQKGYFKGVTDTNMTLEEILDNCEIVD